MNIKPLFIGPKAENIKIYEELILDIVRDSGYKRKNFHPEDKALISEMDKLLVSFSKSKAILQQEFDIVSAELKQGVPTYHPRHIGHMFGDLLIPALVGYFSTMLNNPNNVVGEVSPVTTRYEIEFAEALATMVGYTAIARGEKTDGSWGHITNGGTTANIEALWLARNLKYYPVSLKLLSKQDDFLLLGEISVELPNGVKSILDNLDEKTLFNLSPDEAYLLRGKAIEIINSHVDVENSAGHLDKAIDEYSVQGIGVAGIHQLVHDLPLPKLFVARTAHYSWKKAMDILGMGKQQLVAIDVDPNFRLITEDLKNKIGESESVLAVISIMGTTEEGTVDPTSEIVKFREKTLHKENKSFFLHIDAAYGGYFMSLLRKENNNIASLSDLINYFNKLKESSNFDISQNDVSDMMETYHLNQEWIDNMTAISQADSITIDPHKLGYVPYPAGAILFRNALSKNLLAQFAPYLATKNDPKTGEMFLGKWSLEGSRTGASATACYLASKVLPFHQNGHGQLLANTMLATSRFAKNLKEKSNNEEFIIIPLYSPDTNIFCYIVAAPNIITDAKWLNVFSKSIVKEMTVSVGDNIPSKKFIVSKSEWSYKGYKNNINRILKEVGINKIPDDNYELIYLRSTFMNPLSVGLKNDFYKEFADEIIKVAKSSIQEIMLKILEETKNERLSVLWIENDNKIEQEKRKMILDAIFGKFLRIDFHENSDEITSFSEYNFAIVDLNLQSDDHTDMRSRETGYEEIKEIAKSGVKDFIIYSTYLNTEENYTTIEDETVHNYVSIFPENLNFSLVKKTDNSKSNIHNLLYKIFFIAQRLEKK